jgi:hypothetical protein
LTSPPGIYSYREREREKERKKEKKRERKVSKVLSYFNLFV